MNYKHRIGYQYWLVSELKYQLIRQLAKSLIVATLVLHICKCSLVTNLVSNLTGYMELTRTALCTCLIRIDIYWNSVLLETERIKKNPMYVLKIVIE